MDVFLKDNTNNEANFLLRPRVNTRNISNVVLARMNRISRAKHKVVYVLFCFPQRRNKFVHIVCVVFQKMHLRCLLKIICVGLEGLPSSAYSPHTFLPNGIIDK